MTSERSPLACPICSKPLSAKLVDGVTADVCGEHGLWLDQGELQKIVESIKLEEMQKASRVIRSGNLPEIAKTTMTEGVLGRWWNRF